MEAVGDQVSRFKVGDKVKLKDDKYTTSPVKTQYGWHVILRTGERGVDAPPFESMKDQLRMRLQNKIVENYIGSLRKGANIERK